MTIDFPQGEAPIIKVIGVGGGGSNAVNHMYAEGIIGEKTAVVTVMHANNETGVIQPISELGALARKAGAFM
ncbi:MAG: aminotransferase class V-fold PLP-dependent enzyme, partial [Bacteroidota bacterium]